MENNDWNPRKVIMSMTKEDFKDWCIEQRDQLKQYIDALADDPAEYYAFERWILTEYDLRTWNNLINGLGEPTGKPQGPLNYKYLVGKPAFYTEASGKEYYLNGIWELKGGNAITVSSITYDPDTEKYSIQWDVDETQLAERFQKLITWHEEDVPVGMEYTTVNYFTIDGKNYVVAGAGGTGDVTKAWVESKISVESERATNKEAEIENNVFLNKTAIAMNTDEIERLYNIKANDTEVVHVMPVPSSTTLTDEERNKIANGIFMNGTFLSMDNPVFYPAENTGGIWYGLVIGKKSSATIFSIYKITSSNVISVLDTSPMSIGSTGEVKVRNVADPTKDTDAANKKYVDEHPGTTYTAGNGLQLNDNQFAIDEQVVATKTELAAKANSSDVYTKTETDERIATNSGVYLGTTQGTALDVASDEAASKFIGEYIKTLTPVPTITKNDYFNIEVVANDAEQNTEYYRYIATGSKVVVEEVEYDGFKFGFKFSGDISLLKSQVEANTTAITNEVSRATTRENEIESKIPEIASEISETSTNEKPAGAKAVYDYIQSLNGNDIEY